jgi:hypothetical protein
MFCYSYMDLLPHSEGSAGPHLLLVSSEGFGFASSKGCGRKETVPRNRIHNDRLRTLVNLFLKARRTP